MKQYSTYRFILPTLNYGPEGKYFTKEEKTMISQFFFQTLTQSYQLGWLRYRGDPFLDAIATIVELVSEDIEGQWDVPYELDPAHADMVASVCLQLYLDVAMIFDLDNVPGDACFSIERYLGNDALILYQGSGALPLAQMSMPAASIRHVTDYYGLHPRSLLPIPAEPDQRDSQRPSRFLLPTT